MDGLTATESLRARRDPPEVIVLTTFDTDEHVLRAMRAGASGFLLKHTPPEEIARGGAPGGGRRADAVARGAAPDDDLRRRPRTPNPRRDRAARGAGAAQPGGAARWRCWSRRAGPIRRSVRRCAMSTATVKAYVSRILTKLDLTNRVQVALLVHDSR